MRSTRTNNQTCMANTTTVHNIPFAALHLNPYTTLAVLHLNPTLAKKSDRRRQTTSEKKPHKEKVEDQRCVPWTPEEEIALCKCWVCISEDSVKGNARKEMGFWVDILNEADDADYLQRAMADYHVEYRVPFTLLQCWDVLKEYQAKRKMKAGSTSSASSFDVEALAKMMASEYVMASDSYKIQKNQEIRRMEKRQRDEALYETTIDEELKARHMQRLFG
nr:hypothetical protein [Tanacetum cinerariifolium]